jgi:hypothetical protein
MWRWSRRPGTTGIDARATIEQVKKDPTMNTVTAPPAKPSSRWIKQVLSDRIVWIGLAVWVLFSAAIPYLAQGAIPFDQPMLATQPYRVRVMIEIFGPIAAFIFIAVAYALTRRRFVDIAACAPERSLALAETLGLLAYGALVLIGGVFVGSLAGTHRLGLHLAGSMFGMTDSVTPGEVWAWTLYNFAFYAAVPYLFFRRRGYSREQLCLKSNNPINDTIVILVILALGLVFDLPGNAIWKLSGSQFAAGATLAFVFSFLGTGLPVMIFLTSILVPRYRKLTGSTAATVVLGGFTYAAMHLSEYWTRYDTPTHSALSVIFIVLFFGGPGMVKTYLTLRTGNAWVHLWGYHVIWPHVTGDTPLLVKIFNLR